MKNEEKKIVKWAWTTFHIIVTLTIYWFAIWNLYRSKEITVNIVLLIVLTWITFREIKKLKKTPEQK